MPRIVPGGDQMPVVILGVILLATVLILLCFNRGTKKKKEEVMPPTPTRLPPTPRGSLTPEKPDLLGKINLRERSAIVSGSTVFASVGRGVESPRQPLKTFTVPPPPATPSAFRKQPPSLDYAGLSDDSSTMPLFRQLHSKPRGATHFWV